MLLLPTASWCASLVQIGRLEVSRPLQEMADDTVESKVTLFGFV